VALDSLSTADLGAGRLDGLTRALKAGVSRGWRPVVLPIVTAALALAAWEALVRVRRIPSAILPPPTEVAQTLVAVHGLLLEHAWPTLVETVAGFLLAAVVGMVVAIAITYSRPIREALYPLLVVFQLIPKVALAPLFIVWLGIGTSSRLMFALFISFFPVVISGVAGLRSTDPELLDLSATMGGTRWQTFLKIRFPIALPHLMAGVKVAVTLAVVGAVVGEFVGASEGLGYVLLLANGQLDAPLLFADLILMSAIGIALFILVDAAEALLIPWHASRRAGTPLTTA